MATTITYKSYGAARNNVDGNEAKGASEITGTISQNDMNFLNITNPLVPSVVSVTADTIRVHFVTVAQGITAGIPSGTYEHTDGTNFRKVG